VYLALAIVSAVVVFLLVLGGTKIISDDEESREKGKSMIKNAIWGFIIILIISGFGCYVARSLNFPECVPCPWEGIYRPPPAWGEYFPVRVNITTPHDYDVFENGTIVNFNADIYDGYPYFDCIWNFNDGTTTEALTDLSVRNCNINHVFDLGDKKFMEYTIDVAIIDDWQFKAKDSVTIYVVAPGFVMVEIIKPEVDKRPLSLGYATAYSGFPTDFEARIISVAPSFNYSWNFGDGTSYNGTTTDRIINVTHTFANPGLYEVRLDVIDNDGNTGNDTLFVYVLPGLCPSYSAYEFINLKIDPDPGWPSPPTPELWEFHFTNAKSEAPFPGLIPGTTECTFDLSVYNYSDTYPCGIMVVNENTWGTDDAIVVWVKKGATIDQKKPDGSDADNLAQDLGASNFIYCPDCTTPGCEVDSARCDAAGASMVVDANYFGYSGSNMCGDNHWSCDTCPPSGSDECDCSLSTSDDAYFPKYAILCGNDGKWYPCISPCCQGNFACTEDGLWIDCSALGKLCRAGECV